MKAIMSVLIVVLVYTTASAQTPKLSSYSSAQAVVFLDFDGHIVEGTAWNWSGPILAQPSGLSSAAITEIFNRVAEDYRIFNVNVTTDSSIYLAAPIYKRTRIIVTPTYEWYGMAGGVAYVGSFTWGDDTPAWVFSGLLGNNVKYVAEAVSHEAGHTLGLQHQSTYDNNCMKLAEYSAGQGQGEISWSPIMGVGYYRNITTWHYGPNAFGCNYLQNDIEIIAGSPNNFGLRSDDFGNNHTQASTISTVAQSFQVSGLINTSSDKDVFRFQVPVATNFRLNAVPQNVGNSNAGANVDVRVTLLNSNGDTLNRYNPLDLVSARIDTTLTAASYYLVVEGTGNSNLSDYGSLGVYTLYGTLAGTLSGDQLSLSGRVNRNQHELDWRTDLGDAENAITLEYAFNANGFQPLANLKMTDHRYSRRSVEGVAVSYRIMIEERATGKKWYSNVVSLAPVVTSDIIIQTTSVRNEIVLSAGNSYHWQLLGINGVLLKSGTLSKGINRLAVGELSDGLMILRIAGKRGIESVKIIKQ